jgi:hypothetical protein
MLEPLALEGNTLFICDFHVAPGTGDEFIRLFREFDYSDANVMHQDAAQVKDGVLCRDPNDADHFLLVGEWRSREAHAAALRQLGKFGTPKFLSLIEGGRLNPKYVDVVAATPPEYLGKQ